MQIDHLAIWTNDLEKIKDFYIKYFDCKCNERYENKSKQFSSYFLTFSNGIRLEIMNRPDIIEPINSDHLGIAHFAINVGTKLKVDSITKILNSDGYIIESQPRTTGDGYYESVILDPENNKVELTAMPEFQINKAQMGDLEAILYLQKCCYLSEGELNNNYNIQPITQTLSEIQTEFKNQLFLKLEYRNKIIGSVRAYEKNGTCFIGKLIVEKAHQNKGFGRLLIESIEQNFRDVKRFELFTSTKSEKNLSLYKKLGYKEFKELVSDSLALVFLEKLS